MAINRAVAADAPIGVVPMPSSADDQSRQPTGVSALHGVGRDARPPTDIDAKA